MIQLMEQKLEIELSGCTSDIEIAQISTWFWKTQYLKLLRDFNNIKDNIILNDELDDGK